jgi:hypothetical protein
MLRIWHLLEPCQSAIISHETGLTSGSTQWQKPRNGAVFSFSCTPKVIRSPALRSQRSYAPHYYMQFTATTGFRVNVVNCLSEPGHKC